MRVLIDADGCPVVNEAIRLAGQHHAECLLFCDTAHVFLREGARTITVSQGADSADLALANQAGPGDIVITQDYGLAALCLAKNALAVSQDGMRYTSDNIDALLLSRHTARKIRSAGGRLKGPPKRSKQQNRAFEEALSALLCEAGQ